MKGGRYGKFKGFNFYLNKQAKITKKQRKQLITEYEQFAANIIYTTIDTTKKNMDYICSSNRFPSTELDSKLYDEEMVSVWNDFYKSYGYSIPKFRDKWEKEYITDFGNEEDDTKSEPIKIPDWIRKLGKPRYVTGLD